jgi:hypothetical protein
MTNNRSNVQCSLYEWLQRERKRIGSSWGTQLLFRAILTIWLRSHKILISGLRMSTIFHNPFTWYEEFHAFWMCLQNVLIGKLNKKSAMDGADQSCEDIINQHRRCCYLSIESLLWYPQFDIIIDKSSQWFIINLSDMSRIRSVLKYKTGMVWLICLAWCPQ